MAKGAVIGMTAHVDAGKTTLSEAMLYLSGAVRRQGRVDHGDAFLDTDAMEKERGITILSKQARLSWKKTDLTLLDTPGHTDFSGETERAIQVMDAAVLVISAAEGVQSHTRTLWHLLEKHRLPVILFVNKMDRFEGNREELLEHLGNALSDRIADFSERDDEKIALCDETCLDLYLREGRIPDRKIQEMTRQRQIFPCFFGAALKNEGVVPLLDFLAEFRPERTAGPEAPFGALVYKVARDAQGARLTFLKVTSGILKARDSLSPAAAGGEDGWTEKAAELRLYSGTRYESVPQAEAGEICCVVGLSHTRTGERLGAGGETPAASLRPCYACRLVPEKGTDLHTLLGYLRTLEEEEPLLQVEYVEARREIRVQSMGEVYLEALARQLLDRYGCRVTFADSGVLYRETIENQVEGVGHYEPLRHYAEVHLLLTPLPRGSGIETDSAVPVDDLALNWQRLIMTHLREKVHTGVLTGAPITDMRITLVAGKAHLKHTEGGDFRQATYRALRQGLMKAKSVLLEPRLLAEAVVPEEYVGRVMSDFATMGGQVSAPEDADDGLRRVTALVPAGACAAYGREIRSLTRGRGSLTTAFDSWQPCPDAERIIAEKGYDPLRDPFNTPDSVFCSHGAGVTVPWDQTEQYMHLPSWTELRERRAAAERSAAASRTGTAAYRGTEEEDRVLRAIFEKTYGPTESRRLLTPVQKEAAPRNAAAPKEAGPGTGAAAIPTEKETLLVDGYNVIHAWEEWKDLVQDHLEAAREQLISVLCNYAGATGKQIILVFDGYRVKGNPGEAEKVNNIFVIYTKEAQTADAYIEKTTLLARREGRVRVVTSDRPEQLIALGNAAGRTSAREFRQEVIAVQGSIKAFLEKHYRPAAEKAVERAYKEAWKKGHGIG